MDTVCTDLTLVLCIDSSTPTAPTGRHVTNMAPRQASASTTLTAHLRIPYSISVVLDTSTQVTRLDKGNATSYPNVPFTSSMARKVQDGKQAQNRETPPSTTSCEQAGVECRAPQLCYIQHFRCSICLSLCGNPRTLRPHGQAPRHGRAPGAERRKDARERAGEQGGGGTILLGALVRASRSSPRAP